MDEQSSESEEVEVMGTGIGESEMEELVCPDAGLVTSLCIMLIMLHLHSNRDRIIYGSRDAEM